VLRKQRPPNRSSYLLPNRIRPLVWQCRFNLFLFFGSFVLEYFVLHYAINSKLINFYFVSYIYYHIYIIIKLLVTFFHPYLLRNYTQQFNVHGSLHRKNTPIYIQQDATLRSLFYLETALHVSGGTTTHHQERKQLYLVFVTPLLLPAAIAAGSSNGATNTRCCRHSCLSSWWWVEVPPETCRKVSR
jgi:hypothetical protein